MVAFDHGLVADRQLRGDLARVHARDGKVIEQGDQIIDHWRAVARDPRRLAALAESPHVDGNDAVVARQFLHARGYPPLGNKGDIILQR